MQFRFKDREVVSVHYDSIQGLGQIVGCATSDMPVIGRLYIVFMFEDVSTKDYPFNTIVIPERFIQKVD